LFNMKNDVYSTYRYRYTKPLFMAALPQHLDLHLIRILYLLLVEKNVSRVALKLNQPQPSISASLRKLRELTGDPLLVRGARGMVPTQHGESLLKPGQAHPRRDREPVRQKSPFVPEEAARTFHIAAPDYLDTQFLPNVVACMRRGSPNSRVAIHGLGPGTTTCACCRTARWTWSSPTGTSRPPTCTSRSCSRTRSSAPCAPTARMRSAPPPTR
jgi:hypothetical protein